MKFFLLTLLPLFVFGGLLFGEASDTRDLVAYLQQLHSSRTLTMTALEFQHTQSLYSSWLDRRVLAGVTPEVMTQELQSAGLLSQGFNLPEALDRTLAGYLTPPHPIKLFGTHNAFALSFGIWTGADCALSDTALVYNGQTRMRFAQINAKPRGDYSYRLSSLDVGRNDPSGRWIAASGWIVSSCTSDWNEALFRIDSLTNGSAQQLFTASPNARNSEGIQSNVRGNLVEFRYDLRNQDDILTEGPGIARYAIVGDQVLRCPPLAHTRGAFITEWLHLSPADVASFSDPAAIRWHRLTGATLKNQILSWKAAARCQSHPFVGTITAQLDETGVQLIFVIAGLRAVDLRMLSVSGKINSKGCQEISSDHIESFLTEKLP